VPAATDVLEQLRVAPLTPRGFLANASNHTLLVQVGERDASLHAVYKPRAGERPLWDFPPGTLWQREAAAFEVSAFLGWGLVPPTVAREDAPMGPGSVQQFIPHDPERHYFVLLEERSCHPSLARMALFDLLVNNADRKASHVLAADEPGGEAIVGCDHGLTFHTEPKLRTVIWELGGTPLEQGWRADLARLAAELGRDDAPLRGRLGALLRPAEVDALAHRAGILRGLRALPSIDPEDRPYPWPPL
jgi:uncharacterized repeat protein (TIGR03843 family)